MAVQIQVRRGTAAGWTAADPTLLAGEIGYETDTGKTKIGDGATVWAGLSYTNPGSTGATGPPGLGPQGLEGEEGEQGEMGPPGPPFSGTLPVTQGGTGDTTLTNHGVLLGQAGAAVVVTTAGTTGHPLVSGGAAADPAFAVLGVVGGGTGLATLTTAYGLVAAGTTATGALQNVGVGTSGYLLKSNGAALPTYVATGAPIVVALSDGATPALDASLATVFTLAAAGDRTIDVPSNATNGQKITIRHLASGGARTLALNTGAGGFRFGTDITALTQTASGKTDYIGCVYSSIDSFWDVVAVTKGF